ncbi:MAG: LTA synthase family protein [Lentimicrobiaceae bacterium]|nr:LTA synthase family protein [Lentimicrobiaceae bacterium]
MKHLLLESVSFGEIALTFVHAIRLDIATISYLIVIPFLILFVALFCNRTKIVVALKPYYLITIGFATLIVIGETGLYGEWQTKLSYRALSYLLRPTEIFDSIATSTFIFLVLIAVAFIGVFYWLYVRFVYPKEVAQTFSEKPAIFQLLVFTLVVSVLLFIGMRGGIGAIPISSSVAYFSRHNILNITAVNPAFNIVESVVHVQEMNENQNPFIVMNEEEARLRVQNLHETPYDSTVSILAFERPNIVMIILESWSADVIESLGGEAGITPVFDELEKEGLLFTGFYSSGNRTQQAMGSLFSGLPALPFTTITSHPEKYASYPTIINEFRNADYYTSFYFGGELNYGNIRSYLIYSGFDKITEGKDIKEKGFLWGKLGLHDSYMLPWFAQQLSKQPEPFFSSVLTISSHSPYDFPPLEQRIEWTETEKEYINSVYYTDNSLRLFFDEAKKQPWYNNTLFILISDHSHRSYRNRDLSSFGYRHIPMLMLGEALKDSLKGQQFDLLMGNADLPATLLRQLNLPTDSFFWSKNVFNKAYKPFSYFEHDNIFGWKTPEGFICTYNNEFRSGEVPKAVHDSILLDAKAFIQVWFAEFLAY